MRRAGALLLVFTAAACSTHDVVLRAEVGEVLNPTSSDPGRSSLLTVHAYFLKSAKVFEPAAHGIGPFLCEDGKEPEAPAFLGDAVVRVVRMDISPDKPDLDVVVEDLPKEATHVGLVAFFNNHVPNDPAEVWSIVVPVVGGCAAFRVAGRKLEQVSEEPAAAAEPAPSPQSSEPKEAPRDRRRR